ncbi:MAG: histidine phosphatase family protein [Myxococcales bacterium]|jgi:probable phosphoglycerate mutase|nr:MAG: histidine phosphatase family protein [Myxococcales bacterium]
MELLLIRHALPLRVEKRDGTPADPPLSPEGVHQAGRLAAWLASERVDAVYSSPLRRARETAEPIVAARGVALRIEPGVVEFDPLSASYVPLEEIKAESRELWQELVNGGLTAGIDVALFRRTVAAALERIVAAHPGERVAVVCHGGVVNAWGAQVLGLESMLFFQPDYTSVSRFLAAGSGERSLLSLNETAHLRAR